VEPGGARPKSEPKIAALGYPDLDPGRELHPERSWHLEAYRLSRTPP
jgi:hypothetical protein